MKLAIEDFTKEQYKLIEHAYVHPSLIAKLDEPIFRYMKIEHLVSMLDNAKLFVANRKSFDDLREIGYKKEKMYLFRFCIVSDDEDSKKHDKELSDKESDARSTCISCWTYDQHPKSQESIMQWKCYGYTVCRIQTTLRKLITSIQENQETILLSEIKYKDKEMHETYPQDIIFTKHIAYQEEQEVRLCVLNTKNQVLLPINVKSLIHRIMLSPYFSERSTQIIKRYLESYDFLRGKIEESMIIEKSKSSLSVQQRI